MKKTVLNRFYITAMTSCKGSMNLRQTEAFHTQYIHQLAFVLLRCYTRVGDYTFFMVWYGMDSYWNLVLSQYSWELDLGSDLPRQESDLDSV